MEYLISAYTDTGMKKKTNQDSICVRRASVPGHGECIMAVLCDGTGIIKMGELASATCVDAFADWFDRNIVRLESLDGKDYSGIKTEWSCLLAEVHEKLTVYATYNELLLGTTVVAFFAYDDHWLVANIGDSRVYERGQQLIQLTEDQSLVAREVAQKRITADQARHHPQNGILLQCLGQGNSPEPVFTEGRVKDNALYFLCSDGLCHELSWQELQKRLDPRELDSRQVMTERVRALTDECKRRGETDNLTGILIKTHESNYNPESRPSRMKRLVNRLKRNREQPKSITVLLEREEIKNTTEKLQ